MDFIRKANLEERTSVNCGRAVDFLQNAEQNGMTFDIIFADPPYSSAEIGKIIPLLDGGSLLRQGGCLIVEHSAKTPLHDGLTRLKIIKRYRYGDTMLSLYRKEG